MKITIDTTTSTTGDLALVSMAAQGLWWWLFCVSCERLGPVPKQMLARINADTAAVAELQQLDLIKVTAGQITIPHAQSIIDAATQRKAKAQQAAQRRWKYRPPTVEEVEEYIREQCLSVDALQFHTYYDARDWKAKGGPVKNWKSVVDAWARRVAKLGPTAKAEEW